MNRPLNPRVVEALEVIAGLRGPEGLHAIRREDLDALRSRLDRERRALDRKVAESSGALADIDTAMEALETALAASEDALVLARKDAQDAKADAREALDAHLALTEGFEGNLHDRFGDLLGPLSTALQPPDLLSPSEAIEEIAARLTLGLIDRSEIESRIAAAGIHVDADGTVTIAGADRTRSRVATAELRIAAAEGAITQRVTLTELNYEISKAKLDPTELPVVDDLYLRMSEVEVTLDALGASLQLAATATEVDAIRVAQTTAQQTIDALEGRIATTVERTEFEAQTARITGVETVLDTFDGATLTQQIYDSSRSTTAQFDRDELDLQMLLDAYAAGKVLREDLAYARQDIAARVDREGAARASALEELAVAVASSRAAIRAESEVRASDIAVFAAQTLEINAALDTLASQGVSTFEVRLTSEADFDSIGSGFTFYVRDGAFDQPATIGLRDTRANRSTNGTTSGAAIRIPAPIASRLWARRVRIAVLARKGVSFPAGNFNVAYSVPNVGASDLRELGPLGPSWAWHVTWYDVPEAPSSDERDHWIGLFGDTAATGAEVQIARLLVDIAPEASALPELTQLSAGLDEVRGLDITKSTALAQFVRNVGVEMASPLPGEEPLYARTRAVEQAYLDINGNLRALVGFEANANGQVSLLNLLAGDGERSYSLARLAADDILLDGTVFLEKLIAGTGSNMLANTEFLHLTGAGRPINWSFGASNPTLGGQTTLTVRRPGESWASPVKNTLMMFQSGSYGSGYTDAQARTEKNGTFGQGIQVEPGAWYEAQARASLHRCTGFLILIFSDAAGDFISQVAVVLPSIISSSFNPGAWPRYWIKGQAPANAATAKLVLRKNATVAGGANSYLFAHEPQIALTSAAASRPNAWSPGHTTEIDGGNIRSKSVTADVIDVDALSAITANLGEIIVGRGNIADSLRSDNYAEHPGGDPKRGLLLDFRNGTLKAAGAIISRPVLEASGIHRTSSSISRPKRLIYTEGGTRYVDIGKNDEAIYADFTIYTGLSLANWNIAERTFVPSIAFPRMQVLYSDEDGLYGNRYRYDCQLSMIVPEGQPSTGGSIVIEGRLWGRNVDRFVSPDGSPIECHWKLYRVF